MVDSNDRDRVVEARDELHRMLNEVVNISSMNVNMRNWLIKETKTYFL